MATVVDFLLFYWKDWYYPAFNLADVAIYLRCRPAGPGRTAADAQTGLVGA